MRKILSLFFLIPATALLLWAQSPRPYVARYGIISRSESGKTLQSWQIRAKYRDGNMIELADTSDDGVQSFVFSKWDELNHLYIHGFSTLHGFVAEPFPEVPEPRFPTCRHYRERFSSEGRQQLKDWNTEVFVESSQFGETRYWVIPELDCLLARQVVTIGGQPRTEVNLSDLKPDVEDPHLQDFLRSFDQISPAEEDLRYQKQFGERLRPPETTARFQKDYLHRWSVAGKDPPVK